MIYLCDNGGKNKTGMKLFSAALSGLGKFCGT
jgi:hypothetical protein